MVEINDLDQYLTYRVEKKIQTRYDTSNIAYMEEVVIPRIREELRIITKLKFSSYFLILADIIEYCHENDIPVGPARGSAGGSVVSYCLWITEIDPLEFDLIFERFLNDERYSPPDIDVDLCWDRRQEVLQYVVNKYGADRVAQIATFGTLSAKSLVDDLCRVYEVPKSDAAEMKRIIDDLGDGDKVKYEKLMGDQRFLDKLHDIAAKEPRVIEGMAKLEGFHRHTSLHAGGVIIADQPMHNLAPTFVPNQKQKKVAVQYEMMNAESVGLLKMDLLGLKTITLIDWAEKDVRRLADDQFKTRGYRKDDKAAFDIINRGDTAGIFQLEGTGITRFAQEMHVESFNDLVALLALYRPGPLDSGSAQQYIDRKNGKEKVSYPHPDLEPILKDTYGIIIYQEQIMHILGVMAGYSMGKADMMRKAMGKKDEVLMDKELTKFSALAIERGYEKSIVDHMCELIKTFGRYGFNKSHAVAYAYLTYWTAVLKARYPALFFAAWLNVTSDSDKMGWIIEMMTRGKTTILPPHINRSGVLFTPTDTKTVRFGLSAIKGMGKSFVKNTISNRSTAGPYQSFIDYCQRMPSIPVDKKEALIGAGAFDFEATERHPEMHRGFLLANARPLNDYAKEILKKPEKPMPELVRVEELTPLQLGELEKQYVSFYLTADPLKVVQDELKMMGASIGMDTEALTGSPLIGGRVSRVHTLKTKAKQQTMAFVDIDDGYMEHSVTFFPSQWKKYEPLIQDDQFVAIRCSTSLYKGKQTLNAEEAEEINLETRKADVLVDIGRASPLELATLHGIIGKYRNPNSMRKLWIKAGTDSHKFLLKSQIRVEPHQTLLDELGQAFGVNSVSLRGGI